MLVNIGVVVTVKRVAVLVGLFVWGVLWPQCRPQVHESREFSLQVIVIQNTQLLLSALIAIVIVIVIIMEYRTTHLAWAAERGHGWLGLPISELSVTTEVEVAT